MTKEQITGLFEATLAMAPVLPDAKLTVTEVQDGCHLRYQCTHNGKPMEDDVVIAYNADPAMARYAATAWANHITVMAEGRY